MGKVFKRISLYVFLFVMIFTGFCISNRSLDMTGYATTVQESTVESHAGSRLDKNTKNIYDYLVPMVKQVALGERISTTFEVPASKLDTWGIKRSWTNTELGKPSIFFNDISELFTSQFDNKNLMMALLADMPYEMYWFDKLAGMKAYMPYTYLTDNSKITITSINFVFQVTGDYKATLYNSSDPKVNTSKTSATLVALNNAKAIVNEYKTLNDYQKLVAYKNEICDLVSYNNDAVSYYPGGYGDPWQLIYVFDNQASTNVVCEGYSKAFQLLCNLTTFDDPSIVCYTVSGTMSGGTGAGAHMWNVISMDDGKNYLVDITNSDTGTVGQNSELFLQGYSYGSLASGYSFNLSPTIKFSYDEDSLCIWGQNATSILNISNTDYEFSRPTIICENSNEYEYNGEKISVGVINEGNFDITCSFVGETFIENDYYWSCAWYTDNNGSIGNKLSQAPENVGTYWFKITATNKINLSTVTYTASIVITPKTLSVSSCEVDNKVYDATEYVNPTYVSLIGVVAGDNVSVDIEELSAMVSSSNVGIYNNVKLSNISLVGSDALNYKINKTILNVFANNVEIIKANMICSGTYYTISEEGNTLFDANLIISAKGILNENVNGTLVWIDSLGNEISNNIEVEQGKVYKFKFISLNPNYNDYTGEVLLWEVSDDGGDQEENEDVTPPEDPLPPESEEPLPPQDPNEEDTNPDIGQESGTGQGGESGTGQGGSQEQNPNEGNDENNQVPDNDENQNINGDNSSQIPDNSADKGEDIEVSTIIEYVKYALYAIGIIALLGGLVVVFKKPKVK